MMMMMTMVMRIYMVARHASTQMSESTISLLTITFWYHTYTAAKTHTCQI